MILSSFHAKCTLLTTIVAGSMAKYFFLLPNCLFLHIVVLSIWSDSRSGISLLMTFPIKLSTEIVHNNVRFV